MDVSMALCRMCEAIIPNLFWVSKSHLTNSYYSKSYNHHASVQELESLAMKGCSTCAVMYSHLSSLFPVPRTTQVWYELEQMSEYMRPPEHARDTENIALNNKHLFTKMAVRVIGSQKECVFDIELSGENHFVSTSMMSDLRITQAKSWIGRCEVEHTVCNARYATDFKPTRLIDVGRKGISPRLIETKNIALHDARYLALSHCWGLQMPKHATTRSATLQNQLAKIPLKTLPRTFSDAIKVTRKLGVRYIWIDSLCIVQDSVEDWQQESALMGKVYSNCLCTIAAAASKDCHGGLFQDQQPYSVLRRWTKDSEKDNEATVGVLLKPTIPLWTDVLAASPLDKRGWTLQEKELSPRILYATKESWHFECREARGYGNFDTYDLRPKGAWERKLATKRCMDPIYTNNGRVEWLETSSLVPQKRYDSWLEMVEGYSRRKLSVETDIFPAISGLASEYTYLLKDQYVAGLWLGDLIRGLCWRSSVATSRLSAFVAKGRSPSWSWAGKDHPISYDLLISRWDRWGSEKLQTIDPSPVDLPQVLDIRVSPEGMDPNGSLTAAFIRLKCQTAPLRARTPGVWYIGNQALEIMWDVKPTEARKYHLLSLGKVHIGLIIQNEPKKDTYIRVGITRLPEERTESWTSKLMTDEIFFI